MLTRSTGADSRMSMAQQSVIKERYYDESDHCQICRLRGKRRTATFFCTNCNMPVCSFCGDQHKATDVTATHDVIPKKHQDGSVATCGIHKSYAVQYYCESCAQLICVNCTMIDHRNHNIVDIQIKVEECKSRLKDTVSELDQKIHQFDRELRKMSDIEIGIEHNRENIRDDVTRKVEALKRRIDEQHQAVLSQLDKYLNGKMDLLQKKKEVVQKRFDEMMAVRVSMDVNRADVVQGEKFITNVVKIMRQVAQFRPPREIDVKDFTGIAFVMTNNDEVGIIEETGKPMIVPQGKRIKHAEKMDHVMLHPANRKVSETVKAMQPGAREWHTLKMLTKFKTNTYFQNPSGIAVLPGGKFIVADARNYGLTIFDRTGRYQQKMLASEIMFPTGVAVTRDGNIAVSTDKFVKIFKPGGIKVGQFAAGPSPGALQTDDNGNFIVSDIKNRNVVIYNKDGEPLHKFITADNMGNAPDLLNIAVGNNMIALSYQQFQLSHYVKLFAYDGRQLNSLRIPEMCHGMQMDRFGNMVVAAGELCYAPAKGDRVTPLTTVDKRGHTYHLQSRCVAFTNQGHICTLHVNPLSKRSEFLILQLGGEMKTDKAASWSGLTDRTGKTKISLRPEDRPPSV